MNSLQNKTGRVTLPDLMSCYAPTRGTQVLVEMFMLNRISTPMRTSLPSIMHRFAKKRKRDTLIRMERRIKHLSKSQLAEILGWIGAVAILGSYALLSLGIVNGNTIEYHLLMLTGSAGLAIITYRHRAFQSFVVNTTFSILAVIAVARIVFFS